MPHVNSPTDVHEPDASTAQPTITVDDRDLEATPSDTYDPLSSRVVDRARHARADAAQLTLPAACTEGPNARAE